MNKTLLQALSTSMRPRAKWTSSDDELLRFHVMPYVKAETTIDWKNASKATGRTTKQCRERFLNVLDPRITRSPFTEEEVVELFRLQSIMGNKWAKIAELMPGRPETAVKNCFYATVRRRERAKKREERKAAKAETAATRKPRGRVGNKRTLGTPPPAATAVQPTLKRRRAPPLELLDIPTVDVAFPPESIFSNASNERSLDTPDASGSSSSGSQSTVVPGEYAALCLDTCTSPAVAALPMAAFSPDAMLLAARNAAATASSILAPTACASPSETLPPPTVVDVADIDSFLLEPLDDVFDFDLLAPLPN